MKQLILVLTIAFIAVSGTGYAACGACGSGHKAKENYCAKHGKGHACACPMNKDSKEKPCTKCDPDKPCKCPKQ